MEVKNISFKHFICVEYPGIVNNNDLMLETLGGERSVSKIVSDPHRRLELRYRPGDPYCKPVCANRFPCTNILMRVKRRRKKDGDGYEYRTEILGFIYECFKFQSMCDFQMLALEKNQVTGDVMPFLDKLIIDKMNSYTWMKQKVPLFLPPPIFSRIDNPIDYSFRDPPRHTSPSKKNQSDCDKSNLIGVSRQRRPHFTRTANYEDEEMPVDPFPEAVEKYEAKLKSDERLDKLKELFDQRPIWSKNALRHLTNLPQDYLKTALPVLAYYFVTGPWRALWVRLGFNPKTDKSCKILQLLDFRLGQNIYGGNLKLNTKRPTSSFFFPNTVNKSIPSTICIRKETFSKDWSTDLSSYSLDTIKESVYKYKNGFIPPYRQMFYQFCDIEDPTIQKMVHSNDGQEFICTERDGWLKPGVQEQCRSILLNQVKKTFVQIKHNDISNSENDELRDIFPDLLAKNIESETEDGDTADESSDDSNKGDKIDDGNEMESEYLEYLNSSTDLHGLSENTDF